jgi:radical SAM superfamily enzyme with C-terminal helix-hairpin-helix motif
VKIAILDGYVDEPSLLGVPPFISPYPRYLAGVAEELGRQWVYLTADEARASGIVRGTPTLPAPGAIEQARKKASSLQQCDMLVVTGGASVPGKYLRGLPLSPGEIAEAAAGFNGTKLLGGPLARFCQDELGELRPRFDHIARRDAESSLFDFLEKGRWSDRDRTLDEENRWAVKGAGIVAEHPDFPRPLIVELSLFRGCVRYIGGGCMFCTDILYGEPHFREPEAVAAEVAALSAAGAVNFRLGGASCIFSYMAEGVGKTEVPRPSPDSVAALLAQIRKAAPGLEVLHTDNANPAMIASHPSESWQILDSIVSHCTGGNVLSLGLESADLAVAAANNLNATPEQTLEAVRMINEAGRERSPTGLPYLLPGLNFVAGLEGETAGSYELDFDFLKSVAGEGLLLRRINIRQVLPLRRRFGKLRCRGEFHRFRDRVRREIDHPMLLRLLPFGNVLRAVHPEVAIGKLTFGRQAGTYPLLVAIPGIRAGEAATDVAVVDHGDRSVTGLPAPVRINRLPLSALSLVRGLGRKRAARLVTGRPFKDFGQMAAALDEPGVLEPYRGVLSFE